MSFDSDSSFWARENYAEGKKEGLKVNAKRLKDAEKLIRNLCFCSSEWPEPGTECGYCKYNLKYPEKKRRKNECIKRK